MSKALSRIKSDPGVMFGKPVIAGTRITVEHILRSLADGDTPVQICADYPPLTVEDIRAAREHADDIDSELRATIDERLAALDRGAARGAPFRQVLDRLRRRR